MQKNIFFACFLLMFLQAPTLAFARQDKAITKGRLMIKLKPAFAYMNADGAGMRAKSWAELLPALGVREVKALSTASSGKAASARLSTTKSGVDLRLFHQISFNPAIPVEEAIAQAYKTGLIEIAEPAYSAVPLYTPNDPRLGQQYHLPLINALSAWDVNKGSNSIIIAILDTGVDLDHPDLAANIYKNEGDPENGIDDDRDGYVDNYWGWDFAGDDYNTLLGDNNPNAELSNISHGTKVAGCASAVTDNAVGIAATGFNAKLMVLKHAAENDKRGGTSAYLENLLDGVIYAATHNADIINASYGSGTYSQIEQAVYKWAALEHGVTIVAAAGNSGKALPNFPSDYDYVLSVSASNSADERADFSNYGYKVDIAAPGQDVLTTNIGGGYVTTGGTSFASPIVAGAAALVKTKYPEFNGAQVAEVLRVTANTAFNTKLEATYKPALWLLLPEWPG